MGAKKVTDEEIEKMNELYKNGYSINKIGEVIGRSSRTVSQYVDHEKGERQNYYKRFTEDQISDMLSLYSERKWDEIFRKFPELEGNKQKVCTLASNRKVGVKNYFWTQDDVDVLITNYGKPYSEIAKILQNRHTIGAIKTKAIKLGLTQSQDWTKEEIEIMERFYSTTPKEEFQKKLPRRTEDAIVNMARKLGIKSYHYINEKYSVEQKQFIIDNYKHMTDEEIAEEIGKTARGVQEQRHCFGIYFINKDYSGYESINKFLRGQIYSWKSKSMDLCNYHCVFTGSRDFVIHHKYGFNLILKETYEFLDGENKLNGYDLSDYTKEELDYILEVFIEIHNRYPLGVCIRKDIHDLFHSIYGSGGNTIEQWQRFEENFRNHKYDDLIKL